MALQARPYTRAQKRKRLAAQVPVDAKIPMDCWVIVAEHLDDDDVLWFSCACKAFYVAAKAARREMRTALHTLGASTANAEWALQKRWIPYRRKFTFGILQLYVPNYLISWGIRAENFAVVMLARKRNCTILPTDIRRARELWPQHSKIWDKMEEDWLLSDSIGW